ncbi:hypothetical protein MUN46_000870 [Mesosutterella sp. AGMB02718]|uniref:Uncharacterized protein n=1 Tax=Mesosutterella faecium TaxID=2925194 RepID=A0ABT7IJH0_9BURK|nr:hypothetical protein [Mesosutterella sp. AGMB02718]MDL2058514.1 hypothetical protein [Mesosutterella sp. AGMB02718]
MHLFVFKQKSSFIPAGPAQSPGKRHVEKKIFWKQSKAGHSTAQVESMSGSSRISGLIK